MSENSSNASHSIRLNAINTMPPKEREMSGGSRKDEEQLWEVTTDLTCGGRDWVSEKEVLSGIMQGSWTGVQVCLTMMPMLVTVQDTPSQGVFWKVTVHTFSSKRHGFGICLCHLSRGFLLHLSTIDKESLGKSDPASQIPVLQ